MSEGMGHRRRVPEDLMGTILDERSKASGDGEALPELRGADQGEGSRSPEDEGVLSWEEHPERVGIAFNLSKQLNAELDKLRLKLELEEDVHPSRSEIAEVALRIAVEDVRERGRESELVRRLDGPHKPRATVRRSVDEAGFVVETTYDENGEILDENVVVSVTELPVEAEYVDEKGRLVSLARDELGNAFEQIMDEEFNPLGTRLLPG